MLRIFDIPVEKRDDWNTLEAELPAGSDFTNPMDRGEELLQHPLSFLVNGEEYMFLQSGKEIHAINAAYLKPLSGDMDYVRFHGRKSSNGFYTICVSIGLAPQAIIAQILPNEELAKQAAEIAEALLYTQSMQK